MGRFLQRLWVMGPTPEERPSKDEMEIIARWMQKI
jgi:hypothetical protein